MLFRSYTAAGGNAKLVAYGPFKGDAHAMFGYRDGLAIWWPETAQFFEALGLPTALVPRTEHSDPAMQAFNDANRLPNATESCKALYNRFLDADYPRAFALSADRRCGFASGGEEPQKRALGFCERLAKTPCALYAIDDALVGSAVSRE